MDGRTFLRTLFKDIENISGDNALVFSSKDPKSKGLRNTWVSIKPGWVDNFTSLVESNINEKNIYVSCAIRTKPNNTKGRGEEKDVCAITALWAEVDFKSGDSHAQQNLPESLEETLEFVKELPIQPSIVNHSGNGVHLWWLLDEPWVLKSKKEKDKAKAVLGGWERYVRDLAFKKGWKLEKVAELARILRIPGTLNLKDGQRKEVYFVEEASSKERFSREKFFEYETVSEKGKQSNKKEQSQDEEDDEPGILAEELAGECAWLKHCRDDADVLAEPEWYAMLSIVALADDGDKAVHEWSRPYKGYDYKETQKKYEHAVQASGPRTCAYIKDDLTNGEYCKDCKFNNRISSPMTLKWMPRLTKDYAYVAALKQIVCIDDYTFYDKEGFNNLLKHEYPGGGNAAASELLLSAKTCTKVHTVTYFPGQPVFVTDKVGGHNKFCFNTYRAPNITPEKGDISIWLNHLDYLVSSEVEKATLLDWMAYTLQYPSEKILFAVLLGGPQGIGKDLLFEPFLKAMGKWNMRAIEPNDLTKDFNEWLEGVRVLRIEEMMSFEKKEIYNTIKPWITGTNDLYINKKFAPRFELPNRVNLLLSSNYEDAIMLDPDDRRFFIIWADREPQPQEYYDKLVEFIESDKAVAAVLEFLTTRDVSKFNAKGRAPNTEGKMLVQEAAGNQLEVMLKELKNANEYPFNHNIFTLKDLKIQMPKGRQYSEIKVGFALKKLGVTSRRIRLSDNTRPKVYLTNPGILENLSDNELGQMYEAQNSKAHADQPAPYQNAPYKDEDLPF